jgi:tetratricopeptide (TPR) repeat protein
MTETEFEAAFDSALGLRETDPEAAVAALEALLKVNLHRASVVGVLAGTLLYEIGDLSRALPYAKDSVALSPRSERASLALFLALIRQGEEVAAFEEARRFLSLRESEEYRRLLQELASEDDGDEQPGP